MTTDQSIAEQLRGMKRIGGLKRTGFGQTRRIGYQTEKAFQRQVEEFASLMGWFVWHDNLPMRSKAGFPDCLFLAERAVWAELKVYSTTGKAGRVMPEQERFHQMLRDAGQEIHVWYDDDDGWAEIKHVLGRGKVT